MQTQKYSYPVGAGLLTLMPIVDVCRPDGTLTHSHFPCPLPTDPDPQPLPLPTDH